jgi:signal transduction histidine kinase
MNDWILNLFGSMRFNPQGESFGWDPAILWLHTISDACLAVACVAIPLALLHFTRRRRDFGFRYVIYAFSAFIFALAAVHLMSVVVNWEPLYWLEGWIKAAAAVLAAMAAFLLRPLMPKVMRLPSPETLQKANADLETQVREREKAEEALRQANITLELNVRERTMELSRANGRLQSEIDERKRVGEALRHSETLLRQFNDDLERYVDERTAELTATIQELESFSYTISHDLRAPLRAINGFAEILREEHAAEVTKEGQALLGKIASNSVRMAQLIDGLLDFSRLSRSDRSSGQVDMSGLVASVVRDLSAQTEERECRVPEVQAQDLPTASGDPEMLRQVWVQLIGNAFKFSSTREAPSVCITGRVEGEEVVYEIRDNGVGFDTQFADKLFGVFQRLHPPEEFPGVGVGLAIVRRIVERHAGRVWARSGPGQGATFGFALKSEP